MSRVQILLIAILGVVTVGIVAAILIILNNPGLMQVPSPTPEFTSIPSDTPVPSVTSTKVILPATWTPTFTLVPRDTPTRLPSVTLTETDIPREPDGSITVKGTGNWKSYVFSLPEGKVTVKWNYAGAPGDGNFTLPAPSSCPSDIASENERYQYWHDYYQLQIDQANAKGDTDSASFFKGLLQLEINRHNQVIADLDTRCQPQTTTHWTSIKASLCHTTTQACQILLTYTGINQGSYILATKADTDYYITVQTPGSWNISLIP